MYKNWFFLTPVLLLRINTDLYSCDITWAQSIPETVFCLHPGWLLKNVYSLDVQNILPFCVLSHLLDKIRTFEASPEENKIQKLNAGIVLGRESWVLCVWHWWQVMNASIAFMNAHQTHWLCHVQELHVKVSLVLIRMNNPLPLVLQIRHLFDSVFVDYTVISQI